MKKRFFSLIMAIIIMVGTVMPSYAAEKNNGLEIKFNEFKYTIYDYDINSVYVEYSKSGITEIAKIKSIKNDEVLEEITNTPFSMRSYNNDYTYAYIFNREAKYGKTKIQLSVIVELYSEGSFRQINSVKEYNLMISSQVAPTTIEDKIVNVWSKTSFPTVELLYGYSGVLLAKVESSISSGASAELLGSGFSASSQISGTTYYRLPFNRTGKISLY